LKFLWIILINTPHYFATIGDFIILRVHIQTLHSNIHYKGRDGNVVLVIFHYEFPGYGLRADKPSICDGISLRNLSFRMPIDNDIYGSWVY